MRPRHAGIGVSYSDPAVARIGLGPVRDPQRRASCDAGWRPVVSRFSRLSGQSRRLSGRSVRRAWRLPTDGCRGPQLRRRAEDRSGGRGTAAGYDADRTASYPRRDRDCARRRIRFRFPVFRPVIRRAGRPRHRLCPLHADSLLGAADRQKKSWMRVRYLPAAAGCGAKIAATESVSEARR